MNAAWEFGGSEIPAPQATMMKMLVEGIMNAQLPWALILTGVGVAIVAEIVGIQVMPFAVGMYLPFSLSAGTVSYTHLLMGSVPGNTTASPPKRAIRGIMTNQLRVPPANMKLEILGPQI